MKQLLSITLMALLILSSTNALAQHDRARNAAERADNRQDMRQNTRQTADDLRDLAVLDRLIEDRQVAADQDDRGALARIDRRVAAMLAAELGEAGREVEQAKAEVRQSRRELRSDQQEIRENRRTGAGPGERRDDRRDRHDDQRDLKDDQRDAKREAARRSQLLRINDQWQELLQRHDAPATHRKTELLHDLRRLAVAEIGSNNAEAAEDRREMREDRRESREDRRQR